VAVVVDAAVEVVVVVVVAVEEWFDEYSDVCITRQCCHLNQLPKHNTTDISFLHHL